MRHNLPFVKHNKNSSSKLFNNYTFFISFQDPKDGLTGFALWYFTTEGEGVGQQYLLSFDWDFKTFHQPPPDF